MPTKSAISLLTPLGCIRAAGRDATNKHKKTNSLLKTKPKNVGRKLWAGVYTLPRLAEDRKGLNGLFGGYFR